MQHTLFPEFYCVELAKEEGILGVPLSLLRRILMTESGSDLICLVQNDQAQGLKASYQDRYGKVRSQEPTGFLLPDVILIFALVRAYYPDCFGERGWKQLKADSDIRKALALLEISKFPGRTTVHDHYNFLSQATLDRFHQLILQVVLDEGLDDFQWLTMDSTAIASVSTWPVDSELLYRLMDKVFHSLQNLIDAQRKVKGWATRMNRLPMKSVENLLADLNQEKISIAYCKGKKGAKELRRKGYETMCHKSEKLLAKLSEIAGKLDIDNLDSKLTETWNEAWSTADDRLFFVQERFGMADLADLGEYAPEKLLSLSDKDAAFIKKGGRETIFGYKPNICRSASGFITAVYLEKGNPADSTVLEPSVQMHLLHTGVLPALVSTDDGYAAAENEEKLTELGVHAFSASGSKGKKMSGEDTWELPLMKEMRRMRSNAEATISHYKIDFNMRRLSVGGFDASYREMKLRAIAFNLEKLGKMLIAKAPTVAIAA